MEKFGTIHKKGSTAPETTKKISELWMSLPEEKKEPYVATYLKAKEKYDAELLAWKENLAGNEEVSDNIKKLNAKVSRKRKLKAKKTETDKEM